MAAALLAGCGRYDRFSLPSPGGSPAPEMRVEWVPRSQPVLGRGAPGSWDAGDVLNPSVVEWKGQLWNLYSGFDGKGWHTGVATSGDGLTWVRRPQAILSPEGDGYIAANGTALVQDGSLWYWYQAQRRPEIRLARSADGSSWNREAAPVLHGGPVASWDEMGVADPYVIRAGDTLYMYYLGQDRAHRQRLGVARSSDGLHWTKHLDNPLLELGGPRTFDENGLGEPAVWSALGSYWMLYTGRDRGERRHLGLARSEDGIHWRKLDAVLAGNEPWMSQVVCDPTVLPGADGAIRVWFGGGDVARPDEHLNGQIGYAELRLVPTAR